MYTHALLLNADYRPVKIIRWERAFILLMEEKAELVVGYVDEVVRSVSDIWEKPAVVRLREFISDRKLSGRVRFNRTNLLARDAYTCQYCGLLPLTPRGNPDIERLTLDHVVPRSLSKEGKVKLPWSKKVVSVTCWENIVTACADCNAAKADFPLDKTGFRLKTIPRAPTAVDVLRMSLTRIHIPDEWTSYLPEGSQWKGYWTNDLED
jgi:5-methylcytosine-specific restriction endonuclease McrA